MYQQHKRYTTVLQYVITHVQISKHPSMKCKLSASMLAWEYPQGCHATRSSQSSKSHWVTSTKVMTPLLLVVIPFFPHITGLRTSLLLLTSFQADSSVSKIPEVPLLAFNPSDGHLPLQNYQSVVNSLAVPLTHPVTLTFLPFSVAVIPAFCQGWAMQATPVTCCVPQMANFLNSPPKQISFQLNFKEFAVIAIYTLKL